MAQAVTLQSRSRQWPWDADHKQGCNACQEALCSNVPFLTNWSIIKLWVSEISKEFAFVRYRYNFVSRNLKIVPRSPGIWFFFFLPFLFNARNFVEKKDSPNGLRSKEKYWCVCWVLKTQSPQISKKLWEESTTATLFKVKGELIIWNA